MALLLCRYLVCNFCHLGMKKTTSRHISLYSSLQPSAIEVYPHPHLSDVSFSFSNKTSDVQKSHKVFQ